VNQYYLNNLLFANSSDFFFCHVVEKPVVLAKDDKTNERLYWGQNT
jgi:hypothetical protein